MCLSICSSVSMCVCLTVRLSICSSICSSVSLCATPPLCVAGELGIFCPQLVPVQKPFTAILKSKRLSVPSSSVDADKGSGMASGILCLVRMLILHELDRIVAWVGSDSSSDYNRLAGHKIRYSSVAQSDTVPYPSPSNIFSVSILIFPTISVSLFLSSSLSLNPAIFETQ